MLPGLKGIDYLLQSDGRVVHRTLLVEGVVSSRLYSEGEAPQETQETANCIINLTLCTKRNKN